MDKCSSFDGNPDFYGLGIRLGIYLQWITTWLNVLLNLEPAQNLYQANSLFVFALTIALVVAYRQDAMVVEIYIIVQISLGFYITSMSTIGFRLWLQTPRTLNGLRERLEELGHRIGSMLKRRFCPSMACDPLSNYLALAQWLVQVSLGTLYPLKHPSLSWSGVLWRSSTLVIITSVNLLLWFGDEWDTSFENRLARQGCEAPYILLFSKQKAKGGLVGLSKFIAVVSFVIALCVAFPLAILLLQICVRGVLCIFEELLAFEAPRASQSIRSSIDKVNKLLKHNPAKLVRPVEPGLLRQLHMDVTEPITSMLIGGSLLTQSLDLVEFWAGAHHNHVTFSDMLRLFVSFGRAGVLIQDTQESTTQNNSASHPSNSETSNTSWKIALSTAYHIWTCLSIAWLITSIECTIRWNSIRDVNEINSTGQLIPFIVGCMSAAQFFKKLLLLLLAKKYPDWGKVTLVIDRSGVPVVLKIDEFDVEEQVELGLAGDNLNSRQTGNTTTTSSAGQASS